MPFRSAESPEGRVKIGLTGRYAHTDDEGACQTEEATGQRVRRLTPKHKQVALRIPVRTSGSDHSSLIEKIGTFSDGA